MTAPVFDGQQACTGAPLDLFFPPAGNGAAAAIKQAKALCSGCRFVDACRDYAVWAQGVAGRYVEGVWGATTSKEREDIRRAQRKAAA